MLLAGKNMQPHLAHTHAHLYARARQILQPHQRTRMNIQHLESLKANKRSWRPLSDCEAYTCFFWAEKKLSNQNLASGEPEGKQTSRGPRATAKHASAFLGAGKKRSNQHLASGEPMGKQTPLSDPEAYKCVFLGWENATFGSGESEGKQTGKKQSIKHLA